MRTDEYRASREPLRHRRTHTANSLSEIHSELALRTESTQSRSDAVRYGLEAERTAHSAHRNTEEKCWKYRTRTMKYKKEGFRALMAVVRRRTHCERAPKQLRNSSETAQKQLRNSLRHSARCAY